MEQSFKGDEEEQIWLLEKLTQGLFERLRNKDEEIKVLKNAGESGVLGMQPKSNYTQRDILDAEERVFNDMLASKEITPLLDHKHRVEYHIIGFHFKTFEEYKRSKNETR